MHNAVHWPESRALRIVLLAPVVILAWFVLTFIASTGSASAAEADDSGVRPPDQQKSLLGGVGSVLDSASGLVGGLVDDTATTVTEVTKTASTAVTTVVAPPVEKPVTAIVTTVVKIVPVATKNVATTVVGVLDTTGDTVETVTDLVPVAVDTVTDLVDDTVDIVTPIDLPEGPTAPEGPAAPHGPEIIDTVDHEVVTDTTAPTSTGATRAALAAALQNIIGADDAATTEIAEAAVVAPAQGRDNAPVAPLGYTATASSASASGSASAPLAALPGTAATAPAGHGFSATPENDVLPSSPVFDTDISPD